MSSLRLWMSSFPRSWLLKLTSFDTGTEAS